MVTGRQRAHQSGGSRLEHVRRLHARRFRCRLAARGYRGRECGEHAFDHPVRGRRNDHAGERPAVHHPDGHARRHHGAGPCRRRRAGGGTQLQRQCRAHVRDRRGRIATVGDGDRQLFRQWRDARCQPDHACGELYRPRPQRHRAQQQRRRDLCGRHVVRQRDRLQPFRRVGRGLQRHLEQRRQRHQLPRLGAQHAGRQLHRHRSHRHGRDGERRQRDLAHRRLERQRDRRHRLYRHRDRRGQRPDRGQGLDHARVRRPAAGQPRLRQRRQRDSDRQRLAEQRPERQFRRHHRGRQFGARATRWTGSRSTGRTTTSWSAATSRTIPSCTTTC